MANVTETVLDRLTTRLSEALEFNSNAVVAPVALLWPDERRQWQSVIGRVRERLPLVSLGAYDLVQGQGPAFWLRCVVMGTLDAGLGDGPPIVYLPGVARSALRAVDDCPPELAPMAELQYRSAWFDHPNGKDWTVRSWLSNAERGMGLPVAEDADLGAATLRALNRLMDVTVADLATETLDADYFRELLNPDPVRNLLLWIDDPTAFRQRLDAAQWSAFVDQCRSKYDLNPITAGELSGAEQLALRHGKWAEVWKRFVETPERYANMPERLRRAKPLKLFLETDEAWPQDNEAAEDSLRNDLATLANETAAVTRSRIQALEARDHPRRGWVWAALGQAPLAFAVEQLAVLADLSAKPLTGTNIAALASDYAASGWRVDDALLRALGAATKTADRSAVADAAGALVRPWLEAGALALQAAVRDVVDAAGYQPGPPAATDPGTVTAFVDGLRLDVAHRLRERLANAGLQASLRVSLAALPTVTPTTKPALAPVPAGSLGAGPDFHAARQANGTKASTQVLRSLMLENSVQVLGSGEHGDPSGSAWTEAGEFDHRGHDVGIRLVDYLNADVERVAVRIRELLDAGWQRVDVVTDHGWLLVPGGMEKVELPVATTESKKGRCARLKPGASVAVPTVPWHWDADVRIAIAPGVTCFEANKEYEHGGVSPQECFIPRLSITIGATGETGGRPEITLLKWFGLLCRIEFADVAPGTRVDLRTQPGDPTSSLAEESKEISGTGKVSLAVSDEDREGQTAHLVLVDAAGQVLLQRLVTVGSNR